MADTVTTNYGWVKPEISASNDTWGSKLNTNFDNIDSKVKSMDTVGAAAKATLVDADVLSSFDSAAAFAPRKTTFAQFKASLPTMAQQAASAVAITGGTISGLTSFASAAGTIAGQAIWHAGNFDPNTKASLTGAAFTGTISTTGDLINTNGYILIQSNTNKHLFFQSAAGINRGLLCHDTGGDPGMVIGTYNSSGVSNQSLLIRESGWFSWSGNVTVRGANLVGGNTEDRSYVDANTFFRWIYVGDNNMYLQRATDSPFATAVTLMQFNPANEAVFGSNVYAPAIYTSANGIGANIKIGDDAWIGDINQGSTISVRGVSTPSWGLIQGGNDVHAYGSRGISGRWYYGVNYFLQTDGNQFLPAFNDYLYTVMSLKAGINTQTSTTATGFPIGTQIIVFTNGVGIPRNGGISPCLSSADSIYYRVAGSPSAGTALDGAWRCGGHIDTSRVLAQRIG